MAKSTIALLLVLVALVGVYQFFLKDKPLNLSNNQTPEASVVPPQKVFELNQADVQEISWQFVETAQQGNVKKNAEGRWSFVRPATVQADSTKVDEFLSSVVGLTGNPRIPLTEQLSLNTVGMEPVNQFVRLTMTDGTQKVLRIGSESVDGSQSYVHLEGTDYVTMIYGYQLDELKKVPTDLEFRPGETPTPAM